jgi:hypothetical protein
MNRCFFLFVFFKDAARSSLFYYDTYSFSVSHESMSYGYICFCEKMCRFHLHVTVELHFCMPFHGFFLDAVEI